MITARAFLVGIVGFCFYLIALVNTLPSYYYTLSWLTLGILVASFGIAVLSIVGLQCEWRMASASVSESAIMNGVDGSTQDAAMPLSGALAEVRLSNSGSFSKTGLVIELRLSHQRQDGTIQQGLVRRRFVVESLPAGTGIEAALALQDLPRGRYRVSEILIIGSDVLGLFRVRRRLRVPAAPQTGNQKTQDQNSGGLSGKNESGASSGEIIVGPATVSVQGGALAVGGGANEGRHATRLVGASDDVGGTRAYVPGDDLRHIHWRSTARLDQLVVKEYHRTAQLQAAVIWDGTAHTTWGEGTVTSTEWGLSLAASLCRALIEAARPCDLLRLDAQPLLVPLPALVTNSEATLARVAETLALADANSEKPLPLALGTHGGRLAAGSTAFLVTASLSPGVQRAVDLLRARGVQVTVALIDGSAFLGNFAQGGAFNNSATAPRQIWQASEDETFKAGEAVVTPEAFRAQAQSLRSSGIPTVLIPAAPDAATRDFAPPLRAALSELLGTRHAGTEARRPAPVK